MLLHLGWATYEGPHHRNPAPRDHRRRLKALPQGLSSSSNRGTSTIWGCVRYVRLPTQASSRVLDSTTNSSSTPTRRPRIVRYANVGRERVIAAPTGLRHLRGGANVDP